MIGSFKDDRYVFIVMEVITGGEMFTHLRRARKFSDEVPFMAAWGVFAPPT